LFIADLTSTEILENGLHIESQKPKKQCLWVTPIAGFFV